MERLTKRNEHGKAYYPYCFKENTCDGIGTSEKCNDCNFNTRVCEKLAEYEDLEEQGRLIELPCKVGDTVYRILDNIYEFEVTCIRLYEDKMLLDIENSDIKMGFSLDANRFTKNLFFTYKEAEKVLAEMGE